MCLIYQDCRGIAGINRTAFVWGNTGNTEVAVFFRKYVANIKEAEKLIYCTSKDGRGDKAFTKVIDLAEREISLNNLLIWLLLQSISKTIIKKFCWS